MRVQRAWEVQANHRTRLGAWQDATHRRLARWMLFQAIAVQRLETGLNDRIIAALNQCLDEGALDEVARASRHDRQPAIAPWRARADALS